MSLGAQASGRLLFRAGRKPMFVFTFDRKLLKFSANSPAWTPLFQFPPRIGSRFNARAPYFKDFIHPPTMRPISSIIRLHTSYLPNGKNPRSFAKRTCDRSRSRSASISCMVVFL